jgi:hypothetical protein
MSDYTAELEAQVEALKAALENERDWNDFMNRRRLSQKYRRWCTKFVVRFRNLPPGECTKIPLKYCFTENVHETLNDTRDVIRSTLYDMIDEYYREWIHKMHLKVKGSLKPVVVIEVTISLFNQLKDKDVYTKTVNMNLVYTGKKQGACLVKIHGLDPGQVQTIDEVILPWIHPDDEYIDKWINREGKDGRI